MFETFPQNSKGGVVAKSTPDEAFCIDSSARIESRLDPGRERRPRGYFARRPSLSVLRLRGLRASVPYLAGSLACCYGFGATGGL